ncbi:MAG: inorganic diphosphatase [Candidatus Moranbacteria bacterium]|nr:inorganic diphosphatase [Candidatus Moranbacteria bacterium]
MENSKSFRLAKQFLGKNVEVVIDRSKGSAHPEHGFLYEQNYGYVENTVASDGEELDAYFLGEDAPIEKATGKVIAIVHRLDDDDDKLVVAPDGVELTDEEIEEKIKFQEKWFEHEIVR